MASRHSAAPLGMCVLRNLLWVVCIAICAGAAGRSSSRLPQLVSPVSFFGYQKGYPSVLGVVQALAVAAPKEVQCPSRLTVRVHKAALEGGETSEGVTEAGRNGDCSEFLRSKCLDRESCTVSPAECKSAARAVPEGVSRLVLQFSCEPAMTPRSLFDGRAFSEGVLDRFLLITGDGGEARAKAGSAALQRSLERCLGSDSCKYVTCGDGAIHSDEYFGQPGGRCALLKPSAFRLAGYAVYPNFTGICNRPEYLGTRDFYEVAKLARGRAHASFVVAYQPTAQFGINRRKNAWVCRGTPTIVPMAGHVVAVPAARQRGAPHTPHAPTHS